MSSYGTSPIKRKRSTKAELEELDNALCLIAGTNRPASVRQLFYLATTQHLVPKTENGYRLVQRRLTELRMNGRIPFAFIRDGGRTVFGLERYRDPIEFLASVSGDYRRDYWQNADVKVEIWLEKDALRGVLYPTVCLDLGLNLYVTRGYSSLTYIHDAAQEINREGKETHIYVLTDFDPSGHGIGEDIEAKLREFVEPEIEVYAHRLAVTAEQIEAWDLPTRPNKRTDTRRPAFEAQHGTKSVELDAIPPRRLRQLVRGAVEAHMDAWSLTQLQMVEEEERESIETIFQNMRM